MTIRQKGHPRLENTTRLHLESKFTEIVGGYHSARTNQSYEERVVSPIKHSKKLNNQANPEYKGLCHIANAQEGYCKPREVRINNSDYKLDKFFKKR
nr:hypothetical protein [Tanacetum cinerariifolium]